MGQQRKGMNLEELRGALASAATRRAEELERENRRLRRVPMDLALKNVE